MGDFQQQVMDFKQESKEHYTAPDMKKRHIKGAEESIHSGNKAEVTKKKKKITVRKCSENRCPVNRSVSCCKDCTQEKCPLKTCDCEGEFEVFVEIKCC